MNDKQRALQLHESKLSYMEIAKTLGIGKTTAYQYVREAKQERERQENGLGLPSSDGNASLEIEATVVPANNRETSEQILITEVSASTKQEHPAHAGLPQVTATRKSIFGDSLSDEQFQKLLAQALPDQKAPQSTLTAGTTKSPASTDKEKLAGKDKLPEAAVSVKSAAVASQPHVLQSKATNRNEASKVGINDVNAKSTRSPAQPSIKPASATLPKPAPKLKEFTGDELLTKEFECLPFTGKFKELIGSPSKLFAGLIWGLPKGGKSNFCIRFADYLQEYFGKVVYIAAEEGESVTLQEKFKDIGGSKVTVVETRDRDVIREYLPNKRCDFVFIDSINNAGIDNDFLELLKTENSAKSFVGIVQATKGGNFKGDQALTHNCDFIIKVVDGIAYHQGRFNVASEIAIFEEPLYEKNAEERLRHYPAAAENGALNSIGEDVSGAANAVTGAGHLYPDEAGKAPVQHAGTEGIVNPPVQVATVTTSSCNDQSSIVPASSERNTSIFQLAAPVTTLPVKAAPVNLSVSSLGSSTSSYRSASTSGTGKAKKEKKKEGSYASGFGNALLIFGGGFVVGYVCVELMNQATQAKTKAAAAPKAQLSSAPAGNRNNAGGQQVKSLQPVVHINQPAIKQAQPQRVPDMRLATQQQQRGVQQPQPNTRPHLPVSAPVRTNTPDEAWWSLDGFDMIL